MTEITESFITFIFKSLIELRIISYKCNIQKIRGPKSHLVYSPKKNFQELQFHQHCFAFRTFQDHSILEEIVSAIFKKGFSFNFICVPVIFQKYAMTSIHENPKIFVNIHYFTNRGHVSSLLD